MDCRTLYSCVLSVLTVLVLCTASSLDSSRFEYFDDYLISVVPINSDSDQDGQPDEIPVMLRVTLDNGDGQTGGHNTDNHNVSENAVPENPANGLDILGYFRDVPREHWSCCMLGKLAGDKGFHCHASFYAARIRRRNPNRAHNAKMLFHGPGSNPNWGQAIMRTFSRCIAHHSADFHKCCYAAAIERTERHRWSLYRESTSEEHELADDTLEQQVPSRRHHRTYQGRS